jgi:hypothetical protein
MHWQLTVLVSTLIALSEFTTLGTFSAQFRLEKGRYYLVFKDRVVSQGD